MLQIKSEDEIELINRSSRYSVSKSLICEKIPFFNELCSSQVVRKFQFDLNESCFESVINWVYSGWIVINMENVLPMHEVSDHLRIGSIKTACQSFLAENFTAKQIPTLIKHVKDGSSLLNFNMLNSFLSQNFLRVINGEYFLEFPLVVVKYILSLDLSIETEYQVFQAKVKGDSSLLNFNMLNSFLSKNFLRIMHGEYFLEFPLEVVKYILSLDLSIENEYQVFQAIMKWIKHNQSRVVHLPDLMKCIRWCYTFGDDLNIKEDEFIVQNLPLIDELKCQPDVCRNLCFNSRIKEKHLISLYFIKTDFIGISYYTGENCWEPCGSFEANFKIPTGIIDKEHLVDVIFDSGRDGLRFDLVKKQYRWLEMSGSPSAYYNQLYDCFRPKFDRESSYRAYIQDGVKKIEKWCDLEKNTLIEYNGEMNIICYPLKDTKLFCFLPVEHVYWYNKPFDGHRIHACILKDVCYIITKSLTFRVFDMVKKTIEKTKPFEGMNLTFEDLQMDQHKSNVLLLIRSQQKIMIFDTCKKTWSFMGQIHSDNKMIAITSTDISFQLIKKLYSKNRVK